MTIPADISREHLRYELELTQYLAEVLRWEIECVLEHLVVTVRMKAHNGDAYILTGKFDGYKAMPPLLDFVDPETSQVGTRHAYPKANGTSLFHGSGPCICAPFSRKAYKAYVDTAPHGNDWQFANWMTSRANNVDWSNYDTLPKILGLINTHIVRPDLYAGRMG